MPALGGAPWSRPAGGIRVEPDEDKQRTRGWSEDFWRRMYGSSIFELLDELAELERRDASSSKLRPIEMIVVRRLEAA
jgi:hypothetical protein